MQGLFGVDGPLYKACLLVYQLIILNLLWVAGSLPVLTIGSSTTALFYALDRLISNKNISGIDLGKAFWKSFRQNLKQATAAWLLLLGAVLLVLLNLENMHLLASSTLAKHLTALQLVVLTELAVVSLYAFPLLARYQMGLFDCLRTALFIGNRHFLTTLTAFVLIFAVYRLILWNLAFAIIGAAGAAYLIAYLTKSKFALYT